MTPGIMENQTPSEGIELNEKEQELFAFLQEIFRLDQSTSNRTNASACLARLKEREHEFIGSAVEGAYWNALSLELFHLGQIAAVEAGDVERATAHFTDALRAAEKGPFDEWLAYVEGTVHYFQNDKAGIEQVMARVEGNKPVLQKLINGLERRGSPDYRTDYLIGT